MSIGRRMRIWWQRNFRAYSFRARTGRSPAGVPCQTSDRIFDAAYAGTLIASNITPAGIDSENPLTLDVSRWSGAADVVDMLVVARSEPPVIDLGCGPGRMVQALSESGRAALGVDMSSVAVGLSMARGGLALRRRIHQPLPAEGRWGTALLMDGNVGIGGDVATVLARCVQLVRPGGLVICEVDPSVRAARKPHGRAADGGCHLRSPWRGRASGPPHCCKRQSRSIFSSLRSGRLVSGRSLHCAQ